MRKKFLFGGRRDRNEGRYDLMKERNKFNHSKKVGEIEKTEIFNPELSIKEEDGTLFLIHKGRKVGELLKDYVDFASFNDFKKLTSLYQDVVVEFKEIDVTLKFVIEVTFENKRDIPENFTKENLTQNPAEIKEKTPELVTMQKYLLTLEMNDGSVFRYEGKWKKTTDPSCKDELFLDNYIIGEEEYIIPRTSINKIIPKKKTKTVKK